MQSDQKILTYLQVQKVARDLHNRGKRIVLTTGCYDLLHLGHILHLTYCKSRGDILVVSVGSDKTVRYLKGSDRPILSASIRARMLAALACTDYVVISEEFGKIDHQELINLLCPDIYIVPSTDSHLRKKRSLVEYVGGKLMTCRRIPPTGAKGISTTKLLDLLDSL